MDCSKCGYALTPRDGDCPRCARMAAQPLTAAPAVAQSFAAAPAATQEPDVASKSGLQACPACGRQVSLLASACLHCGHPLRAATRAAASESARPFALGLAALGLLLALGGMYFLSEAHTAAKDADFQASVLNYNIVDLLEDETFLSLKSVQRADEVKSFFCLAACVVCLVPAGVLYKAELRTRLARIARRKT